mgnify:CR=1 FL=1
MLEQFFLVSLITQITHSVEELGTGFHKKWYLFKMPFNTFLLFELAFSMFWIAVQLFSEFPYRHELQKFFLVLMFANGVQHIVWWGVRKEYVPGLITAFVHIVVFLSFYFQIVTI